VLRYPKPAILARVPPDRHAILEASAGTGKTYTIAHLVVELLLARDVSLDQVLVLTYTEKAATELRRRVRSLIEQILASQTAEVSADALCWTIDATARARLEHALLGFDLAAIDTIHAFFRRILTENAFSSNRLFAQTLEDGRALFSRAFKAALRREFAREGEKKQFLSCWLEWNGVEELEDLLYRCHVRRRELHPEYQPVALRQLLARCPVEGLEERLEGLRAAFKQAKVNGNTINAALKRLRSLVETVFGHATEPHLPRLLHADLQEAFQFLGPRIGEVPLPAGGAGELLKFVRDLEPLCVSFQAALVQTLLPSVRDILHWEKAAHGFYDFDDMIAGVWDALQGPRGEDLRGRLRGRYRYALIDEFQDTDDLQWKVFRNVFFESGGRNLLYLIGDPKQAIYAFRGADVYTYLAARDEVLHAQGDGPVLLEDNFRSTAPLIAAYNCLFDQQAAAPFFTGEIQYSHPVRCGKRDWVAQDAAGSVEGPIRVLHFTPEFDTVSAHALRRHFGRRIAREIHQLLSTEEGALYHGPTGARRRIEARDIFILTALRREGDEVAAHLRAAGIAHAFYKQEGLFQTAEARDVRDLLAAVDDPQDRSRRFKAWLTPFFAVPLKALPDCLEVPPEHGLIERLLAWKELALRRDYEALFAAFLEQSGLIRRELLLNDSERELTNYLHIFEILLEEARTAGWDLAELVRTLQAFIDETRSPAGENGNVQRLESERDAVQIMTMHKSKGLEAAVVFLYGGLTSAAARQGGLFEYQQDGRRVLYVGNDPQAKELAQAERLKEYQRLLYVALTRAKARLYLPHIDPGLWSGQWDGCYRQLNDRLAAVLRECQEGQHAGLFVVEPDDNRPFERASTRQPTRPAAGAAIEELLLRGPDDVAEFQRLKQRHAAFDITSYTRMKRTGGGYISPLEVEEFKEDATRFAPHWLADESLPGGAATGTFLHELLEHLPFETFAGSPALEEWSQKEEVQKLFTGAVYRHGIDPRHLPESQRIIYHTLSAMVPLGAAEVPGLYTCAYNLREVEFLYPYPEVAHARLGELAQDKFVIERGYVKGFIDFVFEHHGRVYAADWKSDILPEYSAAAVAEHVQRNYLLQIMLYSLALVKMLEIHKAADYEARFGGLVYCFLRGMGPTGAGSATHFVRPSWSDIQGYEQELIEDTALAEEKE
jgi:exodeoxyribonuclease V beta subunit